MSERNKAASKLAGRANMVRDEERCPSRDELFTVSWTPSEEVWGGLARAIMMALDMGALTPCAMFEHLERTTDEIPDWLRNEPEMQALDHVPSKGTRCVIIYRAMLEASRREGLRRMIATDEEMGLYSDNDESPALSPTPGSGEDAT